MSRSVPCSPVIRSVPFQITSVISSFVNIFAWIYLHSDLVISAVLYQIFVNIRELFRPGVVSIRLIKCVDAGRPLCPFRIVIARLAACGEGIAAIDGDGFRNRTLCFCALDIAQLDEKHAASLSLYCLIVIFRYRNSKRLCQFLCVRRKGQGCVHRGVVICRRGARQCAHCNRNLLGNRMVQGYGYHVQHRYTTRPPY